MGRLMDRWQQKQQRMLGSYKFEEAECLCGGSGFGGCSGSDGKSRSQGHRGMMGEKIGAEWGIS